MHLYSPEVKVGVSIFHSDINLFENDINDCLRQVHPATLDMDDQSLVDCLHTLIMAKSDEVTVDGFEMEDLDFIINSIACH